jgi:hypothetical protein
VNDRATAQTSRKSEQTQPRKVRSTANAKSSRWKKFLLLTGSLVICGAMLLVGELVCTYFLDIHPLGNSSGLFKPERFGESYGNTVNVTGSSFGVAVQTDANGFRVDPDHPDPEQAPGVLILGDSVGFGSGVVESATCAGLLRAAFPDVHLYNSSVIGYCATDYLNVATHFLSAHPEVKSVVLLYCLNDNATVSASAIKASIDQHEKPKSAEEVADGTPWWHRSRRPAWLSQINAFLRTRSRLFLFAKSALVDTRLAYFQADAARYDASPDKLTKSLQPLADVHAFLASRGIPLHVYVLPYEPQLRAVNERFLEPQQKVTQFLSERQIPFTDTTETFRNSGTKSGDLFLFSDPMHFAPKGHEILADILRKDLETSLSPSRQRESGLAREIKRQENDRAAN